MLHVRWHLFHEFLFVYFFLLVRLYDIIANLQYFNILFVVHSFLSVMKINDWHSIEQCKIDASIDQWLHDSKYGIFAKGRRTF